MDLFLNLSAQFGSIRASVETVENTITWRVTFLGGSGDISLLRVIGDRMNHVIESSVHEAVKGSKVGGTFKLWSSDQSSGSLAVGLSATEFEAAFAYAFNVSVHVDYSRDAGSHWWIITYLNFGGNRYAALADIFYYR